jgi:glycosyltransferase involved in cell wall biosynthesis
LLAVSPVSPWPSIDGMSLRVSRLLSELSQRWRIVLVCPSGGEPAAKHGVTLAGEINFPRSSRWMYLPSQYDVEPVTKTVAEAVNAYEPGVTLLWGGMEYLRPLIPGLPPSVSDRVDCMTLSAWRLLYHSSGRDSLLGRLSHLAYVARYEFTMRRSSRATVVVGDSDATLLRRVLRVQNVQVIPNGVDISELSVDTPRSTVPTVMFTGVMSYQPNIDAVAYFANKVWPAIHRRLPNAVFQIVGRIPTQEVMALAQRPGIEIKADVESVQAELARAWLAVAPMQTGCGIKNKVLEAWSVGTPAVMSPIATNGLGSAPAELLMTAEGAKLSEMIVELLLDGERRQSIGKLARSIARDTFSWRGQAAAFDRLLERVVFPA